MNHATIHRNILTHTILNANIKKFFLHGFHLCAKLLRVSAEALISYKHFNVPCSVITKSTHLILEVFSP